MPTLDHAGARIRWQDAGPRDAPALLLLHAGIATSQMWTPQWTDLSRDHHIVSYDLRWFGRTRSDDVEYTNRSDAIAVLDAAEVEHATLIGASYGGGVAIDTVLAHPQRVSGLVTIGSGPSGFSEIALTPREDEMLASIDAAEERGDWESLVELEAVFWGVGPTREVTAVDAGFLDRLTRLGRQNIPQLTAEPRPRPLTPRAFGRLAEVAIPALILVGEHDMSLAHAQAEKLLSDIPNSTLRVLPGTAHLPSIERPSLFLEELRRWLTAHDL